MKNGWKTSEFWLSLLGLIATQADGLKDDPRLATPAAIIVGAYALARGFAKLYEGKPPASPSATPVVICPPESTQK